MKQPEPAEQLIGALVPTPIRRPLPPRAPVPALPATPPAGDNNPLLDVARLDQSGRLSARQLLRALGWHAGHRVDIGVAAGTVVVTSSRIGRHMIGTGGDLALPVAARTMIGIDSGQTVVLVANPSSDELVIYPGAAVARLLTQAHTHSRSAGDHDDR